MYSTSHANLNTEFKFFSFSMVSYLKMLHSQYENDIQAKITWNRHNNTQFLFEFLPHKYQKLVNL